MRIARITPLVLIIAGALTGCANPEGVWHVYRTWAPLADDACVEELTHNFTNLYTPETETTEDPWTVLNEEERSDAEFFGSLAMSGEEYIFVVGNLVYEGVKQADGTHLFTADSYTTSIDTETHSTGYSYSIQEDSDVAYSMRITFDGDLFTGDLDTAYASMMTWTESDNWSQELADTEIGTSGQIPSSVYFQREIEGNVVPAFNNFDRADCTSNPCTITAATSCSYGYDVTGNLTDLTYADFDVVDSAGQGAGYQGP